MRDEVFQNNKYSMKLKDSKQVIFPEEDFPIHFKDFWCRSEMIYTQYSLAPQFCRAQVQNNMKILRALAKERHEGKNKEILKSDATYYVTITAETARDNKSIMATIIDNIN